MIRKDVIFAVLTTFCLCALMFTVIPIRSGLPYDPWADINDDGTINMKDIANVASQFGTSGDSTKNVNVTNFPSSKSEYEVLHLGEINMSAAGPIAPNIGRLPVLEDFAFCGGYSRMTVMVNTIAMSSGVYTFTLIFSTIDWNSLADHYEATLSQHLGNDVNFTVTRRPDGVWEGGRPEPFIIQTSAPYFRLWFYRVSTDSNAWAVFDVYVYLRNE